MSEPWFNPNLVGGLLGAGIGLFVGLWGSLCGALAPRARGKTFVFSIYWLFLATGVSLLAAGIYGAVVDQPWGVWFGLMLPGAIIWLVVAPLGLVARHRYREAEFRKMQAVEFE